MFATFVSGDVDKLKEAVVSSTSERTRVRGISPVVSKFDSLIPAAFTNESDNDVAFTIKSLLLFVV